MFCSIFIFRLLLLYKVKFIKIDIINTHTHCTYVNNLLIQINLYNYM